MDLIRLILRYLHFFAWAALIGGAVVQLTLTARPALAALRVGARMAFLSGVLLVVVKLLIESRGGAPVNLEKYLVKALITAPVLILIELSRRQNLSAARLWGVLGLSGLAMGVAVFWI